METDPPQLSKEQVLELRSTYFSKSVSLSYANSGPLMIVKGSGSRLFDETGVSYLDTRNNVAHVGHCNEQVADAVALQVRTLNTNTRYLHPTVSVLAQRLIATFPPTLQVVFFVNSGSEANDLALRLARAATGSSNTIVASGAYHGHTLATLEISPYKYETSREFDGKLQSPTTTTTTATVTSTSPGQPTPSSTTPTPGKHIWKVPCPDTFRGEFRTGPNMTEEECGQRYADYVKEACQHYTSNNADPSTSSVGAFILEGGMSVGGVILPPRSYLKDSVEAVRNAGGLYIADEVQTGFGRLGSCFWGFQYNNDDGDNNCVTPDIVTVGKPFGNGMPLGAVITTTQIATTFENMNVEYFNTFGGNPVCAAAGLAMLDEMERLQLQQNALAVGQHLRDSFFALDVDCIGDIRGSGLFMGIEIVQDRTSMKPASAETSFICSILKEKYYILTSIDGPHDNVLVIKPPLVFSKEDADFFVDSFAHVIRVDLEKAGDLSGMAKTPT